MVLSVWSIQVNVINSSIDHLGEFEPTVVSIREINCVGKYFGIPRIPVTHRNSSPCY